MAINNKPDSLGTSEPSTRPLQDEESPLLHHQPKPAAASQTDPSVDGNSQQQTAIADESSNSSIVLTLGSVYFGVFLGALDSSIISTLSAPISTSFDSLSLLSWLASAYLIANAACQPLSGRLTDIFGRRTGLVVSNIFFAAGNLMCGLANDEWTMVAGRVVSGMGGGGLMAISTFLASDLVPLRKRGVIQGIGNVCFGSGAGLGGVFGGWVHDNWGWRYAFLIQVPLVIISGTLVFFLVNVPPKKSEKSKLSRVDFLGAVTLTITLVLLLLGLNSGGNVVPWSHPLVLISLPLSVVALVVFIYIEAYLAKEAILPVRLLLNRTVAAACLTNWFTTMVVYMVMFYMPLFFQVSGLSATASGARIIPQSIGSSVGSLSAGLVMNHTGKYKTLGLTVLVFFVLGTGLLATLTFDTPEWPAFVFLFFVGSGYGGMLTVTLLATISAVEHEQQAVITSATYAFRSTGSTIGVTIASAVYQNILKSGLYARFGNQEGAADEINRIRDSMDELKHLPDGWKEGVLHSFVDSFRAVFLTAFSIALLGLVCGCFIRQHTLHSTLARS